MASVCATKENDDLVVFTLYTYFLAFDCWIYRHWLKMQYAIADERGKIKEERGHRRHEPKQ